MFGVVKLIVANVINIMSLEQFIQNCDTINTKPENGSALGGIIRYTR